VWRLRFRQPGQGPATDKKIKKDGGITLSEKKEDAQSWLDLLNFLLENPVLICPWGQGKGKRKLGGGDKILSC